jgi:uncharacterized membrane protein
VDAARLDRQSRHVLAFTVAILIALCLGGGAYFASRAPAVTFGLFGLDVLAVVLLLLLSARWSERAGEPDDRPDVAVPGEPPHPASSG